MTIVTVEYNSKDDNRAEVRVAKANIKLYTIGDEVFQGVEKDGKLLLIGYVGRKGDCLRG